MKKLVKYLLFFALISTACASKYMETEVWQSSYTRHNVGDELFGATTTTVKASCYGVGKDGFFFGDGTTQLTAASGGSGSACIGTNDSSWSTVAVSSANYVVHNDTRTYNAGVALIVWTANAVDSSSDVRITFTMEVDGLAVSEVLLDLDNGGSATKTCATLRYLKTFTAASHNVKIYVSAISGTHNLSRSLLTVCVSAAP